KGQALAFGSGRMTGGSPEPLERDLYKVLATDLPHARRLAFGVVLGQAGVTVAAALCAWGIADRRAAFSALLGGGIATAGSLVMARLVFGGGAGADARRALGALYRGEDRKSTRLNSSHLGISYAVFC